MNIHMKYLLLTTSLFAYGLGAQVPTLSVQSIDTPADIYLQSLKVSVEVVGNIATTTYDMTFHNPTRHTLEGELSMPLHRDQEICRYALEVNGQLREGVVVEKVKARQTFEAIVRGNVDPGMVAKTKGNFYKTRIYPLLPHTNKRVVIGFVETLPSVKDQLQYMIPVDEPLELAHFELEVHVFRDPSITKPQSTFGSTAFDAVDDMQRLTFKREDYVLDEPLRFQIPNPTNEPFQVTMEEHSGQHYFYVYGRINVPKPTPKRPPVNRVAIYWDHSFSAEKRDREKELNFLRQYIGLHPSISAVQLYGFDYDRDQPFYFEVADVEVLYDYLAQLPNDGATRLNQLVMDDQVDEILFFSDLIPTIGSGQVITGKVPVHVLTSSPGADRDLAMLIAAETGGKHLDLSTNTVTQTIEQVQATSLRLLSTEVLAGKVSQLYPAAPVAITKEIHLSGVLETAHALIKLGYGYGDQVVGYQEVAITGKRRGPVARIWADQKINHLSSDLVGNKKELYSLSKAYGILAPNTAFMVLETLEDYVRYRIEPPSEWREAYYRMVAAQQEANPWTDRQILDFNWKTYFEPLQNWYEQPQLRSTKRHDSEPIAFNLAQEADEEFIEVTLDVEVTEEAVIEEIIFEEAPGEEIEAEIAGDYAPLQEFRLAKTGNSTSSGGVQVLSWLPDAPYMDTLRHTNAEHLEQAYLSLKVQEKTRPAFYLQTADYLFQVGEKSLAARVLSNIVELDIENPELMKVAARKFLDEGMRTQAILIFEEVKALRPEEPQSYRDLALAYQADLQYQKAFDLYLEVLHRQWPRFDAIKSIVLNEINRLLLAHGRDINARGLEKTYRKEMPLDVRVVIDWSSNDNDIDLWVVDPNGEKCFYSNPVTKMGGKLSQDFTQGYGPEEFTLKEAKRGVYTVYANYYSESRQRITGPVTVYVTLITNYATRQEKTETLTLQLEDHKETLQIGQLTF